MRSQNEVTVCIVDDDASVRRALTRLLKAARYRVETFESAGEFLQRGDRDGTCCVLLDVRMQGITGFDLYQRLRRTRPHVAVIFMTGHAAGDLAALAGEGTDVDVLMKPLGEEALLSAIERAIERSGSL
jgi:FixJ family two-component response regulator